MEISSKELGKLLMAFGRMLTKEGIDSMDRETNANTVSSYLVNSGNAGSDTGSSSTFTETAPESCETFDKVTSGTFETENTVVADSDSQRIAELERELAKLQSTQNQSGLDLKPIKL